MILPVELVYPRKGSELDPHRRLHVTVVYLTKFLEKNTFKH